MSLDPNDGSANQSGAEPVYGAAYGSVHTGEPLPGATGVPPRGPVVDGPAPPYTAPYPPYPSNPPAVGGLSIPVASGLAYFTIIPAIIFLLSEPYRSEPQVRFHCWQSIFYFLAAVVLRIGELLLMSMLPWPIAMAFGSLLSIALFIGWLIAVIKAFQGVRWYLPVIGSYAAQTADSTSSR